ncbi:hypothetical protein [Rhizobium sp. BK176]|uniref:hypothetical protein n=1 Tax=Rhizobium sp. BK176 TaxID=2587071 RepID=UPI002168EADE|nr:hypothetical protein [Rhizobium sp. BK176]MCS4088923.1 hypothetical protein [Rhizobium sp. BK176]
MSIASPSLAAIHDRTRYDVLLAGIGSRRNELLAAEYKKAVNAAAQELDVRKLKWVGGKDANATFYAELDLSSIPADWSVLGAAAFEGERVWVVSVGPQATSFARWTNVHAFGYRHEQEGYRSDWVASGSATERFQIEPKEFGPEFLSVHLAKELATMWAVRDLERT